MSWMSEGDIIIEPSWLQQSYVCRVLEQVHFLFPTHDDGWKSLNRTAETNVRLANSS